MGKYLNAIKKITCERTKLPVTKLTKPPEISFGSFGTPYLKRLRENIVSPDEKSSPQIMDEISEEHADSEVSKLTELSPGDCESCPAVGTWDHNEFKGKAVCFHRAYFLAKAGNPVKCDVARRACPLKNQGQETSK